MYLRISDEVIDHTENMVVNLETYSDVSIKSLLAQYCQAIREARRIEADRKELEQYSKPLVPLDVPPEVWKAASAHYVDAQWTPAPNHHPEYRDVRAAFRATLVWLREMVYWKSDLDAILERAGVPPTDHRAE